MRVRLPYWPIRASSCHHNSIGLPCLVGGIAAATRSAKFFVRLLCGGIRLRTARPNRDVAEGQRLQDAADAAFIHRHEKARQDTLAQVAQPPAHDRPQANGRHARFLSPEAIAVCTAAYRAERHQRHVSLLPSARRQNPRAARAASPRRWANRRRGRAQAPSDARSVSRMFQPSGRRIPCTIDHSRDGSPIVFLQRVNVFIGPFVAAGCRLSRAVLTLAAKSDRGSLWVRPGKPVTLLPPFAIGALRHERRMDGCQSCG